MFKGNKVCTVLERSTGNYALNMDNDNDNDNNNNQVTIHKIIDMWSLENTC